jgi:hypothetical protein
VSNRRKIRGTDWEPLSRKIRTITVVREAQLRAEIDQIAPGFLDQLKAAADDGRQSAERFRDAAKNAVPGRFHEADSRDVPLPVLDQVHGLYLRVITELAQGKRKHCRHVSLKTPIPAFACVHADWIYCRSCFRRQPPSRPLLTEREEHTCDLCGTWRHKQTMHALYPQVGPVMLIIGICPRCKARITSVRPDPGGGKKGTP